ncbi:MAG: hypothetical protein IPO06_19745 [Leptospiraceae bacterium]|nr:hypothetical protein [Leptospiraceae bacterium]MBK7058294.1 hypothetical protein [Leptospiraceae bacterium]MBK9501566.1 hypothetical protein [Leptospiraceae bacterium]
MEKKPDKNKKDKPAIMTGRQFKEAVKNSPNLRKLAKDLEKDIEEEFNK